MANVSHPRSDLEAYRNPLMVPPELLSTLVAKMGKKLTTYVAGGHGPGVIEAWMAGERYPAMRRNACALPIRS
jgi:hypothetical protein